MLNKFFTLFKGKKKRYREKIKKEKSKLYLLNETIHTGSYKKSKKPHTARIWNQLTLKFNFNKQKLRGLYIIIVLVLLIAIAYIFRWQYFDTKNIEIYTNDKSSSISLWYKAVNSLRWKNIFLHKSFDVKNLLMSYQPNLQSVKVSKLLPNTLKITIDSFPSVFKTTLWGKQYVITSNWIAIPFNPSLWELELIEMSFNDVNAQGIIDYKNILSPKAVESIYILVRNFTTNLVDIQIKRINYYQKERELHITLQDDTVILFDIYWNITSQIEKLVIYYKDYSQSKKVYIDLRVKNKVFYCDFENEFQCRKNLSRIYSTKN